MSDINLEIGTLRKKVEYAKVQLTKRKHHAIFISVEFTASYNYVLDIKDLFEQCIIESHL